MGELEAALVKEGAKVQTVTNVISAFWMIERQPFDGAVIDKGLHNEVMGLCAELQSLNVPTLSMTHPMIFKSRPHKGVMLRFPWGADEGDAGPP